MAPRCARAPASGHINGTVTPPLTYADLCPLGRIPTVCVPTTAVIAAPGMSGIGTNPGGTGKHCSVAGLDGPWVDEYVTEVVLPNLTNARRWRLTPHREPAHRSGIPSRSPTLPDTSFFSRRLGSRQPGHSVVRKRRSGGVEAG
jgi:hypothetical protein